MIVQTDVNRTSQTLASSLKQGKFDGLIGVLAFMALWEVLTRTNVLPSDFLPPISVIVIEFFSTVQTSQFWLAVGWTLLGWALGLSVAMILGIPLGILVGRNKFVYESLRAIIEFLRSIPSVAWIPVIVILSGVSLNSLVYLAIYASFWPLFIQSIYGVQEIEPVARDTARVFALRKLDTLWRVTLPSTMPYIGTGVRISSNISLMVVVATGMIVGAPGLGASITLAQTGGAISKMYALLLAMGILAWILNQAIWLTEQRLLRWHLSQGLVGSE